MNDVAQSPSSGFFPNTPDATGQVFSYRFNADGRLAADDEEAAWTWRSYLANDIRARMTIDRDAVLPSTDGLNGDLLKIGTELDEIEDRIVGEHWHNERQQLNETCRRLVLIHREMASAAGLFRHLEHQHHSDLPVPIADMAARLSNRAAALNNDGEQLQAQARLLQDELMAKLTAQSNQLLYLLSLMTAVLLPMTVISGLFGMNVGGIPMGENSAGFWTISFIAAAVAASCYFCWRIGGSHM